MFRRYVLPILIWIVYSLWAWTWRKKVVEPSEVSALRKAGKTLIFAHWHGDELCIVHMTKAYQIATMTSTSRDGELMDAVIRKLGGKTSRGSATRGGTSALKGLIRLCREGRNASMAVDGPKGPLHQVKAGVFELARLTEGHIVPVGVATSSQLVFRKSWNQARIAKPFSRLVVQFGKPWPLMTRNEDARDPKLAAQLASDIFAASQQASQTIADI